MNLNIVGLYNPKQNNKNCKSCHIYNNLSPLKKDTVSFTSMKKSQFEGIDIGVVNAFKAPIEKFNSNEDFQNWCNIEIKKLKKIELKGRQKDTKLHRKEILKKWYDYIFDENTGYNKSAILLILNGLMYNIKDCNDALPPIFNKEVLNNTINEINEIWKENPKIRINFNTFYNSKLRNLYLSNDENKDSSNYTGWIIIPSKKNDSDNFNNNIEKLKVLAHDDWCIKSYNTVSYLSKNDFHIYMERGKPKICIKCTENKIKEIQGEKNDYKIPIKYFNIVMEYIKNKEIRGTAKHEIAAAQKIQQKIDSIRAKIAPKDFNDLTPIELFNLFQIKAQQDKDGLMIISEFRQPDCDFTFSDIGINENKLFEKIKEIKGDADFSYCEATKLGNIKLIGGNANFESSQITTIESPLCIEGNAEFWGSKIKNLGNLKHIKGNADFENSQVENLGNLLYIDGDANFWNCDDINLNQLTRIGGNAIFIKSKIKSLCNLQHINGEVYIKFSALDKKQFSNIAKYVI